MKHKKSFKNTFSRGLLCIIAFVFTFTTLYQTTALADDDFDTGFAARNDIEFYHPCGTDEGADSSNATPGEYIKLGDIPKDGLIVGASVFGGKQQGGKWVANWADNNGNDKGNHDNHLTGTTSFAELTLHGKLGDALGDIPNGSKLEITMKSGENTRKIIAEKGDVGSGGDDVSGAAPADGNVLAPKNKGKQKQTEAKAGDHVTVGRAVDLWWETANLLGMGDGTAVATVHAVAKNTPVTALTSKPTSDNSNSTSGTGSCCDTAGATGDGSLMGKTNEEKIWNFLVGNDGQLGSGDVLSANQAAGLMGNIETESTFNPKAENGIGAFGIVQWLGPRRTNLEKAAKKKGVPPTDLNLQLHFLVDESKARHVVGKAASKYGNSGKSEWATLRKQDTIFKAADFWNLSFEISGTSGQSRANKGEKIYKDMIKKYPVKGGGGSGSGSSGGGGGTQTTIFLDPGHGGDIPTYTDPASGLAANETDNGQEDKDVLDVANKVKTALVKDGYKVDMSRTKNNMSASDTPKFRARADAAAKDKATMGVSIHTSPGGPNDAWSQKVGTYRQLKDGSHKDSFKSSETANKSQTYAKAIADARTDAEKHKVGLDSNHAHQQDAFGRGKSPGNIPFEALWSPDVPWIYNEIEQDKGSGLGDKTKEAYAKGLIAGIEKAVPATTGGCDSGANASGLAGYIQRYAWPTYHSPPYFDMMPDYKKAVAKAQKDGRYVGGGIHPGIDCGGFVTTIMVDSGFEPKYNSSGKGGNVTSQTAWLSSHWERLGPGGNMKVGGSGKNSLKLGDVAVSSGHTFIYSGKDIPGFKTATGVASASYSTTGASWRTPMAGRDPITSSEFTWYRKK